jgi:hypothetical protein
MRRALVALLVLPTIAAAASPAYYLLAPPEESERVPRPDATPPRMATWPRLGTYGSAFDCDVAGRYTASTNAYYVGRSISYHLTGTPEGLSGDAIGADNSTMTVSLRRSR